jgi:hypothetical protein
MSPKLGTLLVTSSCPVFWPMCMRAKQFRGTVPQPDAFDGVAFLTNWECRTSTKPKKYSRGLVPFATYSAVMRCLHSDQQPTEKQRQNACGLFSQWRQANGKRKP